MTDGEAAAVEVDGDGGAFPWLRIVVRGGFRSRGGFSRILAGRTRV